MAVMDDYRKPIMDLEHASSPDLVAEAVSFVLTEQDKREEHLTVLQSASAVASTKNERLDKIMINATFSQGGEI